MKMKFTKYQGTGNDFIIVDNRDRLYENLDVAALCHPKFGIGADGLMLLQKAEGFDFDMVYYNSDGKISTMCGNGGRCIVDFAWRLGVFTGENALFRAIDGPHRAVRTDARVELQMKDVEGMERRENAFVLDTGSPHYVVFTGKVDELDLLNAARAIRYNDEFRTQGINVNFVQETGPSSIRVRTYERGVENETLSCGTGVTASAIAFSSRMPSASGPVKVSISTPGGDLEVRYTLNGGFKDVWLCGPATPVFTGEIEV